MPAIAYNLADRRTRQLADLADDLRDACRLRGLGYRLTHDGYATILRGRKPAFSGSISDALSRMQSGQI